MEIVIDGDLERALRDFCRETGRVPEEFAADVLRRYLRMRRFEQFRAELMPYAAAAGFRTDEDVFRAVS
jgi:hypothetical protein